MAVSAGLHPDPVRIGMHKSVHLEHGDEPNLPADTLQREIRSGRPAVRGSHHWTARSV